MPFFKDNKEMYLVYQIFFDKAASHPDVGSALADSNLIVSFKVKDPEGEITINCKEEPTEEGKSFSYIFGENDLTPDFTISSPADFCHKFWLGKVDIVSALFSGEVKADGDFSKAMKLLPILKNVNELYNQVLKDIGRDDLT